ncbi:hypothetical protein ACXYMO_10205 [Arenibacterium sp. CAU 1754]
MKPITSLIALVLVAPAAMAHDGVHIVPHDATNWATVAAGIATIAAAAAIGWAKR